MHSLEDTELLAAYVTKGSEEAFATLVERHVGLVFSSAMRQVGDASLAQEITQAVFVILSQKAASLRRETVLAGWLSRTARFAACNVLKTERSRQRREQEAYMNSLLNESEPEVWPQIMPLLDEAVAQLNKADRNAVVLRFYEQKSLQEVGRVLGVNEDSAQKRVSRALEKLRKCFLKRGVVLSSSVIAGAVAANSVQAAPVGLAVTVTATAKSAAVGSSTLTIIKGALKLMAWAKAKTAIVVGASVLFVAGTTTVTVSEIQKHRSWRVEGFNSEVLDRQPPQVQILPSKLHGDSHGYGNNGKMMGTGVSAQTLISAAYGFPTPARTVLSTPLSSSRFDYIASLPAGNEEALRREVQKTLGFVAKLETRPADVLLLKVKTPNAPGLKPSASSPEDSWESWGHNNYQSKSKPTGHLSCVLELASHIPVIDATGLTNNFDMLLKWNQPDPQKPNVGAMNEALINQLGLELVPTNIAITMLVVEKAK